ncbi:patatin-like phospholipase family protein [Alkalihalobacillus sp. AL-G]|uniref:patatin-like phospholipase family protein n=1 Tax=Alkalihalobacillus sp. AL-G TaxID=2926399 RepID=UPI00272C847C|nr:patatin-like phospholipase family protein [Alkalihalobacillus sp. AL-G]WLD92008.1 patatin-like phospholipase family protein [Alkalihalobacillus sp. AL-G]
MDVDGVFSGGGVKAIAFIGALQVAETQGITFKRSAGTSAGAIIASLVSAGYHSEDIKRLIHQVDLKEFLDPRRLSIPFPFMKWLTLYWKLGLYKGKKLENWIEEVLAEKGVKTFADVPEGSLKIIASDITNGRMIVLPDDLERYGLLPERFKISKAVRMSASIPYFFDPIKIYDHMGKKNYIVDGGVLSNFPIWLFQDEKNNSKRPILGFQLRPSQFNQEPNRISNAISLFHGLFDTMMDAHDNHHISEAHSTDIVFIPVKQISMINFDLSEKLIDELTEVGKENTEKFLRNWRYRPHGIYTTFKPKKSSTL